ncbi:MAG TPA: hypothetical protein VKA27_11610 [Sunxiuqinia sp.]|nr:hypothetical protein [Sunxiuqinia sp.]
MPRYLFFIVISVFLLNSCAVQHHSISGIRNWSYPQNQLDKQFDFRYVDHILEKTENKRAARWANRKNIHVISICLINNGKTSIHGTQLSFYNGDEKAEIMRNLWLGRKVRQRVSPLLILALPAFIIEDALFQSNDDEYGNTCSDPFFDDEPSITQKVVDQEFKKQVKANFNLTKELMNFQLANQALFPGKPVYGVVGIKCKGELNHLHVVVKDVDFQILSTAK